VTPSSITTAAAAASAAAVPVSSGKYLLYLPPSFLKCTSSGVRKIPWYFGQVKYLTAPQDPSFFPEGPSSATPTHEPPFP